MNSIRQSEAAFTEAYASLNTSQKHAVDTIEGPVMVIAGPGTGKTQILTLRIANILRQTQMDPQNILALTFTDAGAKAMRERLHRYIGAAAYQVSIYTFHGFAQRLIAEYPDAYSRVIGGRAASELDKIRIVEAILESTEFKLLRPIGNTSYYVRPILSILGSLKKEYITPDSFAEVVLQQEHSLQDIEQFHSKGAHTGKVRGEYTKAETSFMKNRELLRVYRQYEGLLQDKRLYDFEDMIVETVQALEKNEDMLRDLQETYQYVLADEHQDVNGSQNKIIELLCNFHDQPNIFVVGDEKQAIYRFQGASLENFLYFEELFPQAVRINLTENYRSGQIVLDAAHSLVRVEEGPLRDLRIPLEAKAVDHAVVERRTFAHQAVEDAWVVAHIEQLIQAGVSAKDVAVIVRTNKEVEHYATLLRKAGVAVEASADGDILDHPITHMIQSIIQVIVNGHDEASLFALIHSPYWGISTNDLIKIASARSYQTSLWSLLISQEHLQDLQVDNLAAVENVVMTLETARQKAVSQTPVRVIEYVLQTSGFFDYVLATDVLEGSRVVRRLYDEIERMVMYDNLSTLSEVSAVLQVYQAYRIALNAPYISSQSEAVHVMTAHKSKGLEFTAVFVPHAVDSVWGGSSKRSLFHIPLATHDKLSSEEQMDDEERLLYVAMTRAKEYLYLSCSEQNSEGKALIASRLFDKLDPSTITEQSTDDLSAAYDPLHELVQTVFPHKVDQELFKTFLEKKGLSATALNNYVRSPYDYLYRNILRIPEVQALPMQFGTAVHGVMEWVSACVSATKRFPSMSEVKIQLETQLARLPITPEEYVRLHEKGFAALVAYIEHAKVSWPVESKVEFAIQVTLQTGLPEFPELTLNGKLDRLDLDPKGNVMRVVDYKTGKPKTRNHIEGKTKDSNGDYKRQLVFYALMLELYDDERYQCKEGVLSFIEPDQKGVIHEEVFVVTDQEIAALKTEIIHFVQAVITGSFLQVPCDDKTSSYCHLANILTQGT